MRHDDMPQPLSRVLPDPQNCNFFIDDGPAMKRPELAVLAAKVISEWSLVDSQVSGVYVVMLGTNPAPGTAVYASLIANAVQKDAIRAVARLALDEEQNDVLEAILKLYATAAKERNKIAHWVWGSTPELPGKALLVEPSYLALYHAEYREYEDRRNRKHPQIGEKPGMDTGRIFVYTSEDFIHLSDRIRRLYTLVTQLRGILSVRVNTAPAHDVALLPQYRERFQALENEPEIRPRIDRRREDRKKTHEASRRSHQSDQPPE
jgi:hypothetical protein